MALGAITAVAHNGFTSSPIAIMGTPELDVPMRYEVIPSKGAVKQGALGLASYQCDDSRCFGVITVKPSEMTSLYFQTYEAFMTIFKVMSRNGYKKLLRVWNYIPRILAVEGYEERYRSFNLGRFDAFKHSGYSTLEGSPASSALGSDGENLIICFLLGNEETINIENPRQVSAYKYPREYGPTPPLFSRASLLPDSDTLLISGTASIVGANTTNVGDVIGQTRETIENIFVLCKEANKISPKKFMIDDMSYRVYVKNVEDLQKVKDVVNELLPNVMIRYVKADVCRPDLLVEIEASTKNILYPSSLIE